jgi:hypothetical protein
MKAWRRARRVGGGEERSAPYNGDSNGDSGRRCQILGARPRRSGLEREKREGREPVMKKTPDIT